MASLFARLFSNIMSRALPNLLPGPTTTGRTGTQEGPGYRVTHGRFPDDPASIIERAVETIRRPQVQEPGQPPAQPSTRRQEQEDARRREPWYQFVHLGMPLINGIDFNSSNVAWIQYDLEHQSLYIEYASGHTSDGRAYRYWTASASLAAQAFNRSSKGKFVWGSLRIEHTLLGHQLNYALVSASELPKWTETPAAQRRHNIEVGIESGSGGPLPVLQLGAIGGAPPEINPPYRAIGRFTL